MSGRVGSGARRAAMAGAAILASSTAVTAAEGERIDWDGDLAPVCGERTSCTLIDAYAAGTHRNGDPLTVLEVGFDAVDLPDYLQGGWDCRFEPGGYLGGREFWLLGNGEPRLILKLCNDGYGAAQVGENWVSIGDGTVEAWGYGGSAWRWEDWGVLDLTTMRLLRSGSCTAYGAWTWSVGAVDWTVPRMLQAWQPMPGAESDIAETDWCPQLDPSSPWPEAPEGYGLGLSIPAYPVQGNLPLDLGGCGQDVMTGDGVSVAGGEPAYRLALFAGDPSYLIVQGPADRLTGVGIDIAWTESTLTTLQYMTPEDTVATEGLGFHRMRLDLAEAAGVAEGFSWRTDTRLDGVAMVTIQLPENPDRAGDLPGGMAVAVLDADGVPLASTAPWREGAPVYTPGVAWIGQGGGGCTVADGVGMPRAPAMLPSDVRQWQ